jgi:ABC-type phosphate/phosphonate transport system substrate-binding protein
MSVRRCYTMVCRERQCQCQCPDEVITMRTNILCWTSHRFHRTPAALAGALAIALATGTGHAAPPAAPAEHALVVCSPGSPGTSDEARARMDAFAAAISARSGTPVAAAYEPAEDACVERLGSAALGLVALPFFLAHEHELGLVARLQVVAAGRPALDRWALVGPRGRISGPAALAGYTIVSSAAYAPAFIRGVVVGGSGAIPADVKLEQSTAVLSALRRAASGEPVAVVLDGTQLAQLGSLPFASRLQVIAQSPPVPAGLVVTVGARVPAGAWSGIERALIGLSSDRAATPVLGAIEVARFEPVDRGALAQARRAFAGAQR